MMCYSIEFSDRIFVRGCCCLSFAKSTAKTFGKNVNKNLNGKYSQKLLDHPKQSATGALKTS